MLHREHSPSTAKFSEPATLAGSDYVSGVLGGFGGARVFKFAAEIAQVGATMNSNLRETAVHNQDPYRRNTTSKMFFRAQKSVQLEKIGPYCFFVAISRFLDFGGLPGPPVEGSFSAPDLLVGP